MRRVIFPAQNLTDQEKLFLRKRVDMLEIPVRGALEGIPKSVHPIATNYCMAVAATELVHANNS